MCSRAVSPGRFAEATHMAERFSGPGRSSQRRRSFRIMPGHDGAKGPMRPSIWGNPEVRDAWGEPERDHGIVCLRGASVREAAVAVLINARRPLTILEIIQRLDRRGCVLPGPKPRQVLADGLGHEVKKGRVVRVRRGVYEIGRVPRTTAWRLGRRWGLRSWPSARWHPERSYRETRFADLEDDLRYLREGPDWAPLSSRRLGWDRFGW